MRKIFIECSAVDCKRHGPGQWDCGVTEDDFINISAGAVCSYYTTLTDKEKAEICDSYQK